MTSNCIDGINAIGMCQESIETFQAHKEKEIRDLGIIDDALLFTFTDDTCMKLSDGGQDCCEHRWMHTDDNLSDFIGAILQGADVREGSTTHENGKPKESQFLIVSTSKGQFTVVNYNKHNGYYGGFSVVAESVTLK